MTRATGFDGAACTVTGAARGTGRGHPAAGALPQDLVERATTSEQVGGAILDGVRRGRYLASTARDAQAAVPTQRSGPPLDALITRLASRRPVAVGSKAMRPEVPA